MQTIEDLTQLDAINKMLAAIGQAPITNLAQVPDSQDATNALERLNNTTFSVQLKPRQFNTDKGVTLTPATGTGFINIPDGTLRARMTDRMNPATTDVARRGTRFYDRVNHTFVFTSAIYMDITSAIEFEDMPMEARWYVTVKATRIFAANSTSGDSSTVKFTKDDEDEALILMEEADADVDKRTQAQASPHVARMRRGQR